MIRKVSDSIKHNILSVALGPLLKIIEAIFDLLIPLIMKAVLDLSQFNTPDNIPNVVSKNIATFIRAFNFGDSFLADALTGGGIILVMGIVGYAITMVAQYLAARSSVNVGTEVRNALYNKMLTLSKKERNSIGNSKILTLINSDTYQVQQGLLLFVRLIVRAPFILTGSLIISFILDWRIGFAFLAIVPLIILVNVLVLRKSSKGYIEIQKDLDSLSNSASEMTEGARVIRASNNQELENAKFSSKTTDYQDKSIAVNRINALINPLTFAITSIVLIVIVFLLKESLFNSEDNLLMASTIIAEMAYLAQIFFVTVQITQAVIDIVKGTVSAKRINEVLMITPQITNSDSPKTGEVNIGEELIKFDHVSFSFDEKKMFLNDLNFQIRKGETFGIIGGTGSGKSTVINLIERFYDVSDGTIFYKGIPLKEYDLKSLRNDIGLVNQKSSLFKGTIKSNYLMAKPDASDEEIIKSLKEAEAYEFVNKYEDKINHEVNEGGTNFSGGQKQRLCIGRALLKHPEILILDDSTSALDLLTDKKIRETVKGFKDMTKVIVSQRVATIQNADFILVLEGGKVVGQGKHKDLMKNCPIYKETYETQIKKE
ncbi:MAG: ABC transporter ATP-binding protein [Bacilli bacterium]|nr:ABC transporter ATP-binding protein [Bacilli bacterium]